MTASEIVSLIQALVWPMFTIIIIIIFYKNIISLLKSIEKRIDSGAEVTIPWGGKLGAVPTVLHSPKKDEPVTENHLALTHSSWRYPKKDAEYERPMYVFHVIIQATDAVLDKIESVRYTLHPTYPNPVQVVTDRKSQFKLKELAWGESNVRAEVTIKGQEEPIKLNRYINLTQTGSRI